MSDSARHNYYKNFETMYTPTVINATIQSMSAYVYYAQKGEPQCLLFVVYFLNHHTALVPAKTIRSTVSFTPAQSTDGASQKS